MWILVLLLVLLSDVLVALATVQWFQKKNYRLALALYIATVITFILAAIIAYFTYKTQLHTSF